MVITTGGILVIMVAGYLGINGLVNLVSNAINGQTKKDENKEEKKD